MYVARISRYTYIAFLERITLRYGGPPVLPYILHGAEYFLRS